MGRTQYAKRCRAGTAAIALMAAFALESATAAPDTPAAAMTFEIKAMPLGEALRAFSAQSGRPVLFSEEDVAGHMARSVQGDHAPEAALSRMLGATPFIIVEGPRGALLVRRAETPIHPEVTPPGQKPLSDPEPERTSGLANRATDPEDTLRVDTVRVTGTSLRGIAPESSPLQMYTRDDILSAGVTSTEQFIRALPQNFGGGSTEFTPVGVPGDESSSYNNARPRVGCDTHFAQWTSARANFADR